MLYEPYIIGGAARIMPEECCLPMHTARGVDITDKDSHSCCSDPSSMGDGDQISYIATQTRSSTYTCVWRAILFI